MLVIVVLEAGGVNVQHAAGAVDLLPIQRQLGMLGMHKVVLLTQCLVLAVLGEGDDLQDGAKLGKDLWARGRVAMSGRTPRDPITQPTLPAAPPGAARRA